MRLASLIILTIASAYGDSRGFLWSDRMWQAGRLDLGAGAKALSGYAFGIATWFLAVRQLKLLGEVAVAVQATGWFLVTILGVAIASGEFLRWSVPDRGLAVVAVLAFALLVYRTN